MYVSGNTSFGCFGVNLYFLAWLGLCQVVDQAKIALTLVQNWICKNEVINLKNNNFYTSYQENIISNPFQQTLIKKNDIILFVIEFRRNFEISLSKFIENIGDHMIGESNHMDGN